VDFLVGVFLLLMADGKIIVILKGGMSVEEYINEKFE
jgi:hypothetical protein